ncbi:hypothetical protein HYH03_010046 [Edaphochlamys debaryana]|uniref:BTB domain-containing protein n=1 Tax=Edaphochlamys debaryana TaxID=47281 RepID=A0A835XZ42_9CHLO|nr:hypothetical protein HYH03_010046 [Edaphochlamys debaryana]|eukprot:KAG2491678.1 hypothetical protein HYH03_010046 [Edaphochlamys debaryana]
MPDASLVWDNVDLRDRILKELPPDDNDKSRLRLVNKESSEEFKDFTELNLAGPLSRGDISAAVRTFGCKFLTRSQREQLALVAAAVDVPTLDAALAAAHVPLQLEHFLASIRGNALSCSLWILPQLPQPINWKNALVIAAGSGHSGRRCSGRGKPGDWGKPPELMIDWILTAQPETCARLKPHELQQVVVSAARGGHMPIVTHFLGMMEESGAAPQGRELIHAAIEGCELEDVMDLWHQYYAPNPQQEPEAAMVWPQVEVRRDLMAALCSPVDWQRKVEWLASSGARLPDTVIIEGLDDLGIVERFAWLQDNDSPVRLHTSIYIRPAAVYPFHSLDPLARVCRAGHVRALEWILSNNVVRMPPNLSAQYAEVALRAGNVPAAVMLMEAGLEPKMRQNRKAMWQAAAAGGHVSALMWVAENLLDPDQGDVLTPASFAAACAAGSTQAMRWLRSRGCGMDAAAWAAALKSGCEAALELLAKLCCPKPPVGAPLVARALQLCEWHLLHYLTPLGQDPAAAGRLLAAAVQAGAPLSAVQWLEGQRRREAEPSRREELEAAAAAARRPRTTHKAGVLDWIQEQLDAIGLEEPVPADLVIVAGGRRFPVHASLVAERCPYITQRLTAAAAGGGSAAAGAGRAGRAPELVLAGADPMAFEHVRLYLYGRTAAIPPALAPAVAELASRLQLPDLVTAAEDALLASVSVHTAVDKLLWAEQLAAREGPLRGLLPRLKAWCAEHHAEIRQEAPASLDRLAEERPELLVEVADVLAARI